MANRSVSLEYHHYAGEPYEQITHPHALFIRIVEDSETCLVIGRSPFNSAAIDYLEQICGKNLGWKRSNSVSRWILGSWDTSFHFKTKEDAMLIKLIVDPDKINHLLY